MAIYREKDIFERRSAANEAKRALLERFKARPSDDDPVVQARKVQRQAILEAREKRAIEKEQLKQERLAREAAERAAREAAEEAARLESEARAQAEAKEREVEENARIARLLAERGRLRHALRLAESRRRPDGTMAQARSPDVP